MSSLCYCCCCCRQFEQNMETKDKNYCSKFLLKYAFNITVDIENLFNYENADVEVCPDCFVKLEDVCLFRNQVEETLIRFSKIEEHQAIKEENIILLEKDNYFEPIPSPQISDDEFILIYNEAKSKKSRKKAHKKSSISSKKPEKRKKNANLEMLNVDNVTCHVCKERFETNAILRDHYKENHFYKFVCEKCGTPFETRYDLTKHRRKHVPQTPCSKCGKMIMLDNLSQHLKRHDKIPIFSCTACPQRFLDYYDRVKHLEVVHGIPMPTYTCEFCQKVFNRRNKMNQHIKEVHVAERKYKCDKCEKSFVRQSCLKKHQIYHTGERNYQCEICQKRYYKANTLKEHLKIHYNVKEHVCHICSKAFTQKCSLKGHLRTHSIAPDYETIRKNKLSEEAVKQLVGTSQ